MKNEEGKKKSKINETYSLLLSHRFHIERDIKGFGFGEDRSKLENKQEKEYLST